MSSLQAALNDYDMGLDLQVLVINILHISRNISNKLAWTELSCAKPKVPCSTLIFYQISGGTILDLDRFLNYRDIKLVIIIKMSKCANEAFG